MKRIKVMIVDDSAVVRQVLTEVLGADESIDVIGAAADPFFAAKKMVKNWPDVVVLDIEMPRMDGISFLQKIMEERPTPVVICSTLALKGAETSLQALAAGAVSVIAKPQLGVKAYINDTNNELIREVKAAAFANMAEVKRIAALKPLNNNKPAYSADAVLGHVATAMSRTTDSVVAIGTSTGGTQALQVILTALPVTTPGMVIVQHMPEQFTSVFAKRLNALSAMTVREAVNGDRVGQGVALIAPGGKHMVLRRSGAHYHVDIMGGPPVNRHCPSVDVLFRSVAMAAGRNALGILLTGMGSDGAKGLKEMLDAGATTLAQNEATSIVYGMPREAVKLGAVQQEVGLSQVPTQILEFAAARERALAGRDSPH